MNQFIFWLYDTPRQARFLQWYRKFFSLEEFENNTTLTWVFGATLLSYYVAFSDWSKSNALTVETLRQGGATCWPYFQNCTDYYFLSNLPYGYSQTTLYMGLMGVLLLIGYCIQKKEWILAHMLLFIPYLWHGACVFFLTHQYGGNYDYYLFTFTTVLLFVSHKEYFVKAALVSFYFLSTAAKIHEAWVLGTYFTPLIGGLPYFPDWSVPFLTNQLIFMEMVGAWVLLSNRPILQKAVAAYFIFFHLYSGILVGYRYPTTVLPTLIIVFALFYKYQNPPVDKKSIAGWLLVGLLFCAQSVPFFIPGDQKFTLEANRIGLYMFESNHQCVSTGTLETMYGEKIDITNFSSAARNRCDPYDYLQRIQYACTHTKDVKQVRWTLDHSINGGPFYREVDVENACALTYYAWSHNEWIKFQSDAQIVGYPKENWFY
ncbi:MAG: hypothetical protein WAX38_00350 [Minisyncoccia bacterium]